jgi:hypothetical protein
VSWTPLWFGKHKGKTLPQILFSDPNWFFWATEEKVFDDKGVITDEARELDRKARNIRIPSDEGEDMVVEYYIHKPTGKFQDMRRAPRNREDRNYTIRRNVIDLSIPRKISPYDKQGCKSLVSDLKFCFFDDSRYRMTKARCEAFFDNDNNFML